MEEESLTKEQMNSDLTENNKWNFALKKKQIIIIASVAGGALLIGLIILIIVLATRKSKKVIGEINCVYNIESTQKTFILGAEYVKKTSNFDIYIDQKKN